MNSLPPEIIGIIVYFCLDFATYQPLRSINHYFRNAVESSEVPTKVKYDKYMSIQYTPVGNLHGLQYHCFGKNIVRGKWDCVHILLYNHGILTRQIELTEPKVGAFLWVRPFRGGTLTIINAAPTREYLMKGLLQISDDELREIFHQYTICVYVPTEREYRVKMQDIPRLWNIKFDH